MLWLLCLITLLVALPATFAGDSVCTIWGEGHILTFDGVKYDTWAVGQHTVLKMPDLTVIRRAMKAHCHDEDCLDDGEPAMTVAIGFKYKTTTITVYALYGEVRIYVNGEKIEMGNDKETEAGNGVTYKSQAWGFVYIKFPNGVRVMSYSPWGDALGTKIWAPNSFRGEVKGLCGNFDGKKSIKKEFLGQNDKYYKLSPPLDEYSERSAIKFVQSWRTKHSDAMLESLKGWEWEEYVDQLLYQKSHQLVTNKVKPWESELIKKLAHEQCAHLKDESLIFYRACLFDIREGITKIKNIAKLVAQEETMACSDLNRGLCRHSEHLKMLQLIHNIKIKLIKRKRDLIGHNSRKALKEKLLIKKELGILKKLQFYLTQK